MTASAFEFPLPSIDGSHPLARANQRWSFLAAHQQPKNRPCHGAVMGVRCCAGVLKHSRAEEHPNHAGKAGQGNMTEALGKRLGWERNIKKHKETRFRASVYLERRWWWIYMNLSWKVMKFTMGFLRIGSMFMSCWVTMSVYEPSGCKNTRMACRIL